MSTQKLSGKVALVTGGSRGIGAGIARALAENGADVGISYVASADKANALVAELQAKGVRAAAFKADQAVASQVDGLVKAVAAHFGRLDILVNNAGVAVNGRVDDSGADIASFDRQLAINYTAVVVAIRSASKLMGEGGRIISTGSGLATRATFPGVADYSATKAAIVGYSKGAARDLASRNITVNVIQSGSIGTDMNPDAGDFAAAQKSSIALGRFGRPEEIAAGVVFLASPEASYITGTVLNIDGGFGA
jgi:3-oxoacyl-[acyl-carrier protein] reductase